MESFQHEWKSVLVNLEPLVNGGLDLDCAFGMFLCREGEELWFVRVCLVFQLMELFDILVHEQRHIWESALWLVGFVIINGEFHIIEVTKITQALADSENTMENVINFHVVVTEPHHPMIIEMGMLQIQELLVLAHALDVV